MLIAAPPCRRDECECLGRSRRRSDGDVTEPAANGTFFAYASKPPLTAETMRQVISGLADRGVPAAGWEELLIDGQVLIDTITQRIDASEAVVAEISTMNFNVLFELGYAVATNKPTWLAFDETDVDAAKASSDVAIFATIGRTEYGGNAEKLIASYLSRPPNQASPLADAMLVGADLGKPTPSSPLPCPSKLRLQRLWNASLIAKLILRFLPGGLMIAPLEFYTRELYRSSAVVLHLLGPQRRRAVEHNARASFLAGFAHGLRLPMIMVVQSGFEAPLDYRDLLFQYDTTAELIEKVERWLAFFIPKAVGTQRRLGRLELDIELPIRSFGRYMCRI